MLRNERQPVTVFGVQFPSLRAFYHVLGKGRHVRKEMLLKHGSYENIVRAQPWYSNDVQARRLLAKGKELGLSPAGMALNRMLYEAAIDYIERVPDTPADLGMQQLQQAVSSGEKNFMLYLIKQIKRRGS